LPFCRIFTPHSPLFTLSLKGGCMKKLLFAALAVVMCFTGVGFAEDEVQTWSYKIGDFDFIAVRDKDTNMGRDILLSPYSDTVKKTMPDNQNPSSINAFVLKTKDKTILFDTGLGAAGGGKLLENMKLAKIDPQKVDCIFLTHMHGDHAGGLLTKDGGAVFSKAVIYVSKPEIDYWTGYTDARIANYVNMTKDAYAGRIKNFEWGEEVLPGVKAIKAVGHTPGHAIYEISSNDSKLLVIGDLVHVLKVQMKDPSMAVKFDSDSKQATDTRKAVLRDAAKNKTKIAGMHIPFPGAGTVEDPNGSGEYVFYPAVK